MRKIVLGAALLLLLGGCSLPKADNSNQEDGGAAEVTTAARPEIGQTDSPDMPSEHSAPPSAAVPAPENMELASPSGSEAAQTPAEEAENTDGQNESFDAAQAAEVKQVEGGIQVVFAQLPQTVQDLEALLAIYPQSDARSTGAFFIASLVRYVDSAEDGLAMIDLLRGPRPMNGMDQDFLKDRLREKQYLPGAYFEGATPENDYVPDTPWTLTVYDDPVDAETEYCYIQVATAGADSRRRITLREKDGQYYLWEYSSVLSGIRLPASQDPWL